MTKYYLQKNARDNSPVQAGNYAIQFDLAMFFGGQWWGIFATDNEDHQNALDKVVGTLGVSEITEGEFTTYAKKKGSRQTHTWVVTESVSAELPTPQQKSESSADSAESETVVEHSMDELLKTKPRDESSAKSSHVTSQSALADTLGISMPKLRELAKQEGNPGKSDSGYSIPQWESFLNKN